MHEWAQLAIAGTSCLAGGWIVAELVAEMHTPVGRSGIIEESGLEPFFFLGLIAMVAGAIILLIALIKLL